MQTLEAQSYTHETLMLEGRTNGGEPVSLQAYGFVHASSRTVIAEVTSGANRLRTEMFSDAAAKSIYFHAREGEKSVRLAMTGIANPDVLHITVWATDSGAPESFRVSVPHLITSKDLKASVLDGRGEVLHGLVGQQPYTRAEEWLGPVLANNLAYEEFMDNTTPHRANLPLAIPGWCMAILCVPVIGIAGLLIRRCRG